MSGAVHVVVGAGGASGRLVVRELVRQCHHVRAVTRDGRDVGTPGVELLAVDAADGEALTEACRGAAVVYFCAMPKFQRWMVDFPPLTESLITATSRAGARLVYADNTWMYGRVHAPMTEETACQPVSARGLLRAWLAERILRAGQSGEMTVSIVRAGELYGPGVRSLIAGNVFSAAARGHMLHWVGNPDLPITPTYIADFASTLTAVGLHDTRSVATWHVPHPAATSGRELAATACAAAGTRLRLATHGARQLRLLGTVVPIAREAAELVYQFEQPFVVDGSSAQAAFALQPTPYAAGVAATLAHLHA